MQGIDSSAKISPLAVIEEGASIGAGVEIGPFCVIGKDVKIEPKHAFIPTLSFKAIRKSAKRTKFSNLPALVKSTKI